MAKAPSAPKTKKKSTTAAKTAATRPPAKSTAADAVIEDAVVIEETTAKAAKPVENDAPKSVDATPAKPQSSDSAAKDQPASATKDTSAASDTRAEDTPPKTAKAKAETTTTAAPATPVAKKGGGAGALVGFVTGGLLAAVIGFGAARYVVPEGWPFPGVAPEVDPVAAAVEAQGAEIATLSEAVGANASAIAAIQADDALGALRSDIEARLTETAGAIETATARLAEIDDRLSAVEKMAPEGSAAAAAAAQAYDRELVALREMFQGELDTIKAAQADAAALQAQAAEAERAAAGRAAMSQVTAAFDNGRPFAEPLSEMAAATGIDLPEALRAAATSGVTTLAALQESFAPAARAALDAATKAAAEDGSISKWQAFVQGQLGTRSLEPKEGDDADAVLSRAEAALRQGQLEAALTELAALPEAAQAPMAAWSAQAQTRLDALTAGAQLAQDLNAK